MEPIKLDHKYQELSKNLINELKGRGLQLTPHGTELIKLSTESWFEEPVVFYKTPPFPSDLKSVAQEIIKQTLQEEHIIRHIEKQKPVPYNELLFALGKAGQQVLKDFIDKGF